MFVTTGQTGAFVPATAVINVPSFGSISGSHYNAILRVTSNTSGILSVPSGLTSYPIGGQTMIVQIGTGQVTISGAAGTTILSSSSRCRTSSINAMVAIIKTDTNEWLLGGDLI